MGLKTSTLWPMKFKRKPIIMVRYVGGHFEYYFQQGNKKISFLLTEESHLDLKQTQAMAELLANRRQVPQRLSGDVSAISLELHTPEAAAPARKKSSGEH